MNRMNAGWRRSGRDGGVHVALRHWFRLRKPVLPWEGPKGGLGKGFWTRLARRLASDPRFEELFSGPAWGDAPKEPGQAAAPKDEELLPAAESLVRAGRYATAVELYRQAAAKSDSPAALWLRIGQIQRKAGNLRKAWEAFELAWQCDPSLAEAFRQYLSLSRELGLLADSVQKLQELVKEVRDTPEPRNYLGVAWAMMGEYQQAVPMWRETMTRFPRYAPAHSNLGTYLAQQGKIEEAMLRFQVAAELDPEIAPVALTNLANLHISRGEFQQALAVLRQVLRLGGAPLSGDVYHTLGHCYNALGQPAKAIESYLQALSMETGLSTEQDYRDIFAELARLQLESGKPAEAEKVCRQAVSRGLTSASLWFSYGQALQQRGAFAQAAEAYKQALRIQPYGLKGLPIYKNLSLVYYRLGASDVAAEIYREMGRVRSEHFLPYFGVGWPQAQGAEDHGPEPERPVDFKSEENLERTLLRCREQVSTRPNDRLARENLADALYLSGRPAEAVTHYRALLLSAPAEPRLWCKLGMAYYINDQMFLAQACFTKAAEQDSSYTPAHLGTSMVLLEQGNYLEAISHLQIAIISQPESVLAHRLLGEAYRAAGRADQARQAFAAALQVDERDVQARLKLAEMDLEDGELHKAEERLRAILKEDPGCAAGWQLLSRVHATSGREAQAREAKLRAYKLAPYLAEIDVTGRNQEEHKKNRTS